MLATTSVASVKRVSTDLTTSCQRLYSLFLRFFLKADFGRKNPQNSGPEIKISGQQQNKSW
jgi:hypothetical protein